MSLQALRELYGMLDEDWYALSDVLRGRASRLSEVQRQRRSLPERAAINFMQR